MLETPGTGRAQQVASMMESAVGDEVNSDDEFIVPPLKRARTAMSGGKELRHVRAQLSNQCTPPSQSTHSVDTALTWILLTGLCWILILRSCARLLSLLTMSTPVSSVASISRVSEYACIWMGDCGYCTGHIR